MYEPGNPITIRHASFYEYLVSCKGRQWYIDLEVRKTFITPKYLERMGESIKYNICDLQPSYVLYTGIDDIDNRVAHYIPPP